MTVYQLGADPSLREVVTGNPREFADVRVLDFRAHSPSGVHPRQITQKRLDVNAASSPSTSLATEYRAAFRTTFNTGRNTYLCIDINITNNIDTSGTGVTASACYFRVAIDGITQEVAGSSPVVHPIFLIGTAAVWTREKAAKNP